MNERIRELMWDAGLNSNYVEGFDSIYSKQLEKFAELIVRECMEQVWYSREDGINGNVSEVIKERTKQHFGVEG